MENYICCPVCDSTRIRERHIGKKGGAIAGGISGALSGAAIGSAIPLVGTIAGRDADLVVVMDCQIPADDLIVHNL
ncbi:hypothetical protein [Enterobacter hormaechei]|uniref:hypothetical protein n=1 Tax=Enterobacter hormaechei TaxID=158836 RepID=UPI0022F0865A|nr:hypothetical protein [Enterobacter hormaechei]MDA4842283.1 hypothetical protein [Enterobacter hormaechei]